MSFKQVYYKFAGIVAKYPISYFLDKEKELLDSKLDPTLVQTFITASRFKMEGENPLDVCTDFISVLEIDCSFTKEALLDKIRSNDFPQEMRNELRGSLVNILKRKDCDKNAFREDLYGLLNVDDYANIYKSILKNGDVDKLNSTLVTSFINRDGGEVCGRILLEEIAKGDFKLTSSTDVAEFKNHLGLFLEVEKNLEEDTSRGINHICGKLGVTLEQNNDSLEFSSKKR